MVFTFTRSFVVQGELPIEEKHAIDGVRRARRAVLGVERIVPILRPFKLASRDFHPSDSVFQINGHSIGSQKIIVMAGRVRGESEQIIETAFKVKEAGAHLLRGGAFKPRTSPYSFQGLGEEGLQYLADARRRPGWPSSPRSCHRSRCPWWRVTPTCSKSAPATCKLRATPRRRRGDDAGLAQTRSHVHHRRAADERRVYLIARQTSG